MAQIRSLLKDACIEIAERKRTCHRNRKGHSIAKGEPCLVIIEELGNKKNYCTTCAAQILAKVEADLGALRCELRPPDVDGA
ncbi:MAG: hypothetical protein NUW01_02045 [Gemmatimonadaceae bacterium]|nr:hypothetical protein [Gemmatimonadaceae bacterium]